MGLTSVQVCMGMDTAEWLQILNCAHEEHKTIRNLHPAGDDLEPRGASHDEGRTESSSPSGDMITCSRPMVEKRLRPPQDQALKCPRCDSTHTKFCYYNNYSLSQPRYFCKTCRRYWTKGGSIRNIPVGGGCRKNKRVSVKKSSSNDQSPNPMHLNLSAHGATDLQLSFPEFQLSHLGNLLGNNGDLGNRAFTENKYNSMLEHPRQLDFMEYKYDNVLGNQRNYDFIGHTDLGLVGGLSDGPQLNFNGLCSPYGMSSFNGNGGNLMETCQRLMQPFDANEDSNALEMKPNKQLLSLDWQDQACSEVGKDSFGYFGGSWNGIMNG